MKVWGLGLCLVLFFGFEQRHGHESKLAPLVTVLTAPLTRYPDWVYRPESVWVEIHNGRGIGYVRECGIILHSDEIKNLPIVQDKAVRLAQERAMRVAIKRFRLIEFQIKFDEPIMIPVSKSILVFVRMRVCLDSAKRAPPLPKPPASRAAFLPRVLLYPPVLKKSTYVDFLRTMKRKGLENFIKTKL